MEVHLQFRSMEVEDKRRPLPNYIERVQTTISPTMRGVLVDWLVEVADHFELSSETLNLAVTYVDRFLSLVPIRWNKLQLLGVSSMLIAAKYQEVSAPKVGAFCDITAHSVSKKEVVEMEANILKSLKFEMGSPTIQNFIGLYVKAGQDDTIDQILEYLSHYLAELSLVDYSCVQFLPSVIAASAVFVARFTINPRAHPWSSKLQLQTGYGPCKLKECVQILHDLQLDRKRSQSSAIREKYRQDKFGRVSTFSSSSLIPESHFEDF